MKGIPPDREGKRRRQDRGGAKTERRWKRREAERARTDAEAEGRESSSVNRSVYKWENPTKKNPSHHIYHQEERKTPRKKAENGKRKQHVHVCE